MKLTVSKILEYYEAFTRIDGYARAVETRQGTQVVVESYDLMPKTKWRCAVNKTILRPLKEAAESARNAEQKKMNDFMRDIDPSMAKEDAAKLINDFSNESNARLALIQDEVQEVAGLMKLSGVGIRIRARDPGIIGILASISQDFIDGEPDYGQDRATTSKPSSEDPPARDD